MSDADFLAFSLGCCFTGLICIVILACVDSRWKQTAIKYDIGGYNPKTSYFELKPLNENK